ncbi:hypothetical protein QBC44DRAFT_303813 [Cladorrhinum sp. PSN332]|nr:hypothetical protein QBC44DRAFT_303813 [Cladorrhinum sp. PSN332]
MHSTSDSHRPWTVKWPSPTHQVRKVRGNSRDTSVRETVEEPSPPPYIEAWTSQKRQCTSEPVSPSIGKLIMLAFDRVTQRLDQLEQRFSESIAPTQCRYSTEEVHDILSNVDNLIDDQLTGIHIELEEKATEGTVQLVAEKTEERQEQFWNSMRDKMYVHVWGHFSQKGQRAEGSKRCRGSGRGKVEDHCRAGQGYCVFQKCYRDKSAAGFEAVWGAMIL